MVFVLLFVCFVVFVPLAPGTCRLRPSCLQSMRSSFLWFLKLVVIASRIPKACGLLISCSQSLSSLSILSPKHVVFIPSPQRGAADAEIKVPSGENTELKRSPFKACSRSVYSHTCYAYCLGFLPCLFLPFRSIHLHFF